MFASIVVLASAETGGEHEIIVIPLREIGWQALNLGILLGVLFYFAKDSVVEAFANRKKQFIEQSEKTKSALKNAELALADVKAKLQTLESGEKAAFDKAKLESSLLKATIIKDSEAQALKLKADAQMVLGAELDKAKAEISAMIFSGAVAATTKNISDKGQQVSKDSESEFLRQMGQVNA